MSGRPPSTKSILAEIFSHSEPAEQLRVDVLAQQLGVTERHIKNTLREMPSAGIYLDGSFYPYAEGKEPGEPPGNRVSSSGRFRPDQGSRDEAPGAQRITRGGHRMERD